MEPQLGNCPKDGAVPFFVPTTMLASKPSLIFPGLEFLVSHSSKDAESYPKIQGNLWYPGPRRWWYPDPRLNIINRVLISTRCIFFFESLSQKNLQVNRACLGAILDEWPTGKFSRVRMSEDKVRTKDSCWSVGTIYDPKELARVSTAGREWTGCYTIAPISFFLTFPKKPFLILSTALMTNFGKSNASISI